MRSNLIACLPVIALIACTPAADKAATGEAVAEGAGVGDGPTGRVGDPVDSRIGNAAIPANINEGVQEEVLPPDGTRDPTVPRPTTTEPAAKPTSIPAQFHGRWGLNANDCQPGRSDAKGLLTIDDARLVFYESRGVLDRIDAWTPANRFTANYGFSGEGQSWERVITFERTAGKLRRIEQGGEEGPVDLTYSACPSGAA